MQNILQSLRLTLLNTGFAKLNATWNFDNVISPFTRMYYIHKGSARVYHSKQVFDLKPHHLYLIPSYTYGRYVCDDYHEQYYISFLEEVKTGVSVYTIKDFKYEVPATKMDAYYFKRLLELNPNRIIKNSDPKTYDNHSSLLNFMNRNEHLTAQELVETQGILTTLLSRFIQNSNTVFSDTSSKNRIKDVINNIDKNLHKRITVDSLANFCYLSTDYFSRIFQKTYGIRPNAYIQNKRIERAQLLLLTTNDSLKEIAVKTGMGNLPYFSRVFKAATGKTPSNFRKERFMV